MIKNLLFIVPMVFLNNSFAQTIPYPIAIKKPVTDTFFKKYMVTDDYRWMENLDNPELKKWITDENTLAHAFITKASSANNTLRRIDELSNVKYSGATKMGKYYFSSSFYDNGSSPAIFVRNSLNGEPRIIIDPNYISHKDKIAIQGIEVSKNSKYLAYEFGRNGSDWAEINVTEIEGSPLKDHLINVKFSNIAWQGNGFFYSQYPATHTLQRTEGQVVYYHKLGTQQSDDAVIFKRNDVTERFTFLTTKDERYFILQEHNLKAGYFNYFYIDYTDAVPALKPLLTRFTYELNIIDSHNGKLIVRDFHGANNGSVVEIDPKNPLRWRAIAPSFSEALLLEVMPLRDKIIAVYQSHLHPSIVAMDYNGKVLHSQSFPLGTTIRGLNGLPDDETLLYSYESYTTPPVVYTLNTENYERKLTRPSTVSYDYENYVYKESTYKTKDSVSVPILLIYKKGIKLDGNSPTLLEAYGGFGIVSTPHFDPGIIYFLSKGGVYAYAYVRGGGELGSKWFSAGRGKYKQNSFSDFIAGAQYLIKEGYTSPKKLAISGASNGGLVVAAAAMQRPDLFKAVVPVVSPMDMLRFEEFTIGSFHNGEYGTVKDSTSFTRLYNYSPYNNIKENVNYPAMLIVTSENDDRVPPFHSFKFAAKIQSRPAQTNPVYLLVNRQAGHYGIANDSFTAGLQAKANIYAFIVEMLK